MGNRRRGRGEGVVRQRADGRWEGMLDLGWVNGRRRRKSVYGPTRAEAASKLSKLMERRRHGEVADGPSQTVEVFMAGWLASVKPLLRPKTYEGYEMYVRRHIVPSLGRIRLEKLGPERVQEMLDAKLAEGLAPQSVIQIRAILRRALGRALRYGWVVRNVVVLTDPPRLERREVTAFTPEQARLFLDGIRGNRWRTLYVLALFSGLRKGELLGLRWSDIDLDSGVLRVNQTVQRVGGELLFQGPKTSKSRRVVALPMIAMEALRQHRIQQRKDRLVAGSKWAESGLVFTTRWGTALEQSNVSRSFKVILKQLGLPNMRFHDLRHSYATLLLVQGIAARVVMDMLGHSQVNLTLNTYTHVQSDLQREAARRLDILFDADAEAQ